MDSVELVKKICKERKIPISKLEHDCGFSNGYIQKLKEGKFPSDRIQIIANYLEVSVDYLMTGEERKLSELPKHAELLVRIRNDKRLFNAIEKYYTLNNKQQEYILGLIDLLMET